MADMKPIGIDQTTGQQRPVASNDSVVDNVGDVIEIAVTQVGDYSGNLRNRVTVLRPWDTPIRLSDPNSLPSGGASGLSWSPNTEFLGVGAGSSPRFIVYQRTGTAFNRLPDPPNQPGSNVRNVDWSSNGEFVAVGFGSNPYVHVYQRDGSTFTKLTDPTTLPAATVQGMHWSPSGEFLALACLSSSPRALDIYRREGTTLTRIASPASAPTGAQQVAFSPTGEFLIQVGGTPNIHWYQRTGLDEFTLLTTPASLPGIPNGVRWSPDGNYVAIAANSGGGNFPLSIYERSGTTLTLVATDTSSAGGEQSSWSPNGKYISITGGASNMDTFEFDRDTNTLTQLSDPASLPIASTLKNRWSSDQQFLAITHGTPDSISIFQTPTNMPDSGIVKVIGQPLAGS